MTQPSFVFAIAVEEDIANRWARATTPMLVRSHIVDSKVAEWFPNNSLISHLGLVNHIYWRESSKLKHLYYVSLFSDATRFFARDTFLYRLKSRLLPPYLLEDPLLNITSIPVIVDRFSVAISNQRMEPSVRPSLLYCPSSHIQLVIRSAGFENCGRTLAFTMMRSGMAFNCKVTDGAMAGKPAAQSAV